MAWNQSGFLQALGWATLNSFWQMGLLWTAFMLVNYFFKPTSNQKYLSAVTCVVAGTGWFIFTFFSFYYNGLQSSSSLKFDTLDGSGILPRILSSASVTYLILLIIPAYKLYRNWRFLHAIRKTSVRKSPLKYSLFVQKFSALLGIKKPVHVHLSGLVTSPVTIGFLKPVILLPLAAVAQLSPRQMEAILIHELTHIRRHDYLLNLVLTAVRVILYFNPFVRLFISAIGCERENCCDELVLQFEYDKISYASALLQLEKNNHTSTELAMGATHKNHLLSRIEKIVGVKKKNKLNVNHFFGAFAALILLFSINSLIIAGREKLPAIQDSFGFSQPVSYLPSSAKTIISPAKSSLIITASSSNSEGKPVATPNAFTGEIPAPPANNPDMIYTAFENADAGLTDVQKAEVKKTVSSTKTILRSKWKDVEQSMADAMNSAEKIAAQQVYMEQVEKLNWQQLEKNMKAGYENFDWIKINQQLSQQIAAVQLDSIKQNYLAALAELEIAKTHSCTSELQPIPDASVKQLDKMKHELEIRIKQITNLRERKIIKL
jgi:bla regulator protein blaR1